MNLYPVYLETTHRWKHWLSQCLTHIQLPALHVACRRLLKQVNELEGQIQKGKLPPPTDAQALQNLYRSLQLLFQWSQSTYTTPVGKKISHHSYAEEPHIPIGKHQLPPLPYPYDALEPYIDEETMRIHHNILHQNYVNGLNKAEVKLQEARLSGDFDLIKHWERELAFNGAGHYLHTLFWEIMSPNGGGEPPAILIKQIENSFGNFEQFKHQFSMAASAVEGGGWAILVWSPRSHRLEILQAEKHQNLSQQDTIPLLALDVWEHAYYLRYRQKRNEYINNWWHIVNWAAVLHRFKTAQQVTWQPY
ncbi:superoxide dismutase [Hazenella sp. IB182353]|uniref:superoxide dismutase n=1 Tax=Polycladospora coralii TaxID=2771432 RepID=UPI001746BD3A|nr:superoxide dismutase [Polycladospora coralii]MBS7530941.1 superoxide dismutase [Polycladospora coralii]